MNLKVYMEKPNPKNYDKELLLELYRKLWQCRAFDASVIRMVSEGKIKGFYHAGSGEEAIGVGSCTQLRDDDYIFYMHRGCNEMIAKGVPVDLLYGDFFGTMHSTNKGLGAGTIHSAYPEKGVLGQPGTIGTNSILGVGVGLSIKYRKTDQVCICYFGDGTAARELLHGALNWSGLYKLPVIFMCENNEFGLSNPYKNSHDINQYIAEYATGYANVESVVVDGNNVLAVKEVSDAAIARARRGDGPTFIEAKTYRHKGHFVGDPTVYRDKVRDEWFINHDDPVYNFKSQLLACEIASESELDAIEAKVKEEDTKASDVAYAAPMPTKDRIYEGLFSEGKEVLTCRK